MRFAIVLALLVACGGAPAKPTAPRSTPTLAELDWLVGSWHADRLDQHFVPGGGSIWGVMLYDGGFEVTELREPDKHVEMFALPEGRDPQTFSLLSSVPGRVEFGVRDRVVLARTGDALHGEYVPAGGKPQSFDATKTAASAPELEAADRAFAAESAATGAEAWMKYIGGGALWRSKGRVEGEAIRTTVSAMLAKGSLAWQPIASGARGDWGFTIGTYAFKTATATSTGSYCTIWQRVDGAWRVAFDLGN